MVQTLIDNPLLLVFVVAAVGYPLGRVKIFGMSLGVAAVLFTGIGLGSLHPDLKVPEIVYVLGQALFVYTVGLAAGPAFASSLKRDGLKSNGLVAVALCCAAILCVTLEKFLHLSSPVAAGMFAGSLTTSPALAGVLDAIRHTAPVEQLDAMLAEPVVGFSATYPVGVIGVVLAISLAQRIFKIDYAAEAERLKIKPGEDGDIINCTIKVWRLEQPGLTVDEISVRNKCNVIFGRVKRGDEFFMARSDTVPEVGDLVMVAGKVDELQRVARALGERRKDIRIDRSEYDYRRVFVSNPDVVGRTIGELNLRDRFGDPVTRVRRGDEEFAPRDEMVLELGDMVRVLAHRDQLAELTRFFGNSYRKVSEVDVMTFSLGLVIGLCLGLIPIPMMGGAIKLGYAGGPLIVALILGTFGRVGGMVWSLPYSANMTLRQIGLVLFLAGIGTKAGYTFFSTMSKGGGLSIFLAGALITTVTSFSVLCIGYKVLKIPMSLLTGMVAGMQTQIAVLGFAKDQTGNPLPDQGYASVYAVATIGKIILVHIILTASG